MSDEQRHKKLIEERLRDDGLRTDDFKFCQEEGYQALLGRWVAKHDMDLEMGPFEGEVGELSCTVVGSPQTGNEEVVYYFLPDGLELPAKVTPFINVVPEKG